MGGGDRCAVLHCSNDRRYPKRHIVKSHVSRSHLAFHSATVDQYDSWEMAINRENYKVSKLTKVCSNHFASGKKTRFDPLPSLYLRGYEEDGTASGPVLDKKPGGAGPTPDMIESEVIVINKAGSNSKEESSVKYENTEVLAEPNDHTYPILLNNPICPVLLDRNTRVQSETPSALSLRKLQKHEVGSKKKNSNVILVERDHTEHQTMICKNLVALWEHKELCDVILHTRNKMFYAHKVVLASTCKTLYSYFMEHDNGSSTRQVVMMNRFGVASNDAVQTLLEFLYTGKSSIIENNFSDLMHVAAVLNVPSLLGVLVRSPNKLPSEEDKSVGVGISQTDHSLQEERNQDGELLMNSFDSKQDSVDERHQDSSNRSSQTQQDHTRGGDCGRDIKKDRTVQSDCSTNDRHPQGSTEVYDPQGTSKVFDPQVDETFTVINPKTMAEEWVAVKTSKCSIGINHQATCSEYISKEKVKTKQAALVTEAKNSKNVKGAHLMKSQCPCCSVCNKTFMNNHFLQKHYKQKHKPDKKRVSIMMIDSKNTAGDIRKEKVVDIPSKRATENVSEVPVNNLARRSMEGMTGIKTTDNTLSVVSDNTSKITAENTSTIILSGNTSKVLDNKDTDQDYLKASGDEPGHSIQDQACNSTCDNASQPTHETSENRSDMHCRTSADSYRVSSVSNHKDVNHKAPAKLNFNLRTSRKKEMLHCKFCDCWGGVNFLIRHVRTEHHVVSRLPHISVNEPTRCAICHQQKYINVSALIFHMRKRHLEECGLPPLKTYSCGICDKAFWSNSGRTTHIKTHKESTFKCKHCKQKCLNRQRLKEHVFQFHQGLVKCDVCGQLMKAVCLGRHTREKHGQEPYVCAVSEALQK